MSTALALYLGKCSVYQVRTWLFSFSMKLVGCFCTLGTITYKFPLYYIVNLAACRTHFYLINFFNFFNSEILTLTVQEANAERAVAVAQQNVNSGTINKLEAEISRLREELTRAEQRATAAEEVRYPG